MNDKLSTLTQAIAPAASKDLLSVIARGSESRRRQRPGRDVKKSALTC